MGKVTEGLDRSTIGLEITGNSKVPGEHAQEEVPAGLATARFRDAGTATGLGVHPHEMFSTTDCAVTAIGAPMIPNESAGDFGAAMRAWSFNQPRDSVKLAMAPPASPSTMEATKNAIANGQPNSPAL
jgi:hypothetical protein